ncbi:D-alanyl-D-alanine carboxypeptidase family protein [Pseudomonas sp. 5P_3.1_Bac2]|uniref:M15 family metallopeptidase n=1 Tax=Pseudomonas sp. 5P_3.1_Bac2 TaxID=2971617 RepID=UPI0021C9F2DB|nr:M15 family metallopeptidase [Pseudomonas sp. 5P_3.1_Bac2]MCU1718480.1 M15 family metallopeptidase [Pseudomonas sp. 5P_3.1_Bac2]
MRSAHLQLFMQEFGVVETPHSERVWIEYEEAHELICAAQDADGRQHWLTPAAANAWHAMHRAASAAGISLVMLSAYRSVERQAQIIRRKLGQGQSIEQVLAVSALPGCSEHHTGRAIDLGTAGGAALELTFAQTPAFTWLSSHAAAYGFYLSYPQGNAAGYDFEPWHWCYHQNRAI